MIYYIILYLHSILYLNLLLDAPNRYKGVADCFMRIIKEEGFSSFYSSLPPRLLSVVPMISIQFGVYEFMKNSIIKKNRNEAILLKEERMRVKRLKRKRLRLLISRPPLPFIRMRNKRKRVEIREKFDNEKIIEEVLGKFI